MRTTGGFGNLLRRIRPIALLLVLVIVLAGCASIARSISKHLAARQESMVKKVLQIPGTDIEKIAECLKQNGPWCDGAKRRVPDGFSIEAWIDADVPENLVAKEAKDAGEAMAVAAVEEVLQHRISRGIQALMYDVDIPDLTRPGDDGLVLPISDDDVDDFLAKIETAVRTGAFELTGERLSRIAGDQEANGVAESERVSATPFAVKAKFLKSYYSAYFRRGEFLKIEANDTNARARLMKWMRERLPGLSDSELEQMVDRIIPSNGFVFGSIGETGFVSRTGHECAFPGIQVSIDPFDIRATDVPEIDFAQVGADLVRIYFEATFDSRHGLPGVTKATGVVDGLLEHHDPDHCVLSAADFQKTAEYAARLEAIAAASTGRIIRGAGPLALNNEAFAQILETVVGVSARKATEKVTWCIFASFSDDDADRVLSRAFSGGGRSVTLEFTSQVPNLLDYSSEEP